MVGWDGQNYIFPFYFLVNCMQEKLWNVGWMDLWNNLTTIPLIRCIRAIWLSITPDPLGDAAAPLAHHFIFSTAHCTQQEVTMIGYLAMNSTFIRVINNFFYIKHLCCNLYSFQQYICKNWNDTESKLQGWHANSWSVPYLNIPNESRWHQLCQAGNGSEAKSD